MKYPHVLIRHGIEEDMAIFHCGLQQYCPYRHMKYDFGPVHGGDDLHPCKVTVVAIPYVEIVVGKGSQLWPAHEHGLKFFVLLLPKL